MFRMCCIFLLALTFFFPFRAEAGKAGSVEDMIIARQTPKVDVEIHYPALGQERIDADISTWAKQLAEGFESDYAEEGQPRKPYELKASYAVTRPSPMAISVIWNVSSYTGGAHGNLDIVTSTYLCDSGDPVDLYDLFKDLDTALQSMSTYAYRQLAEKLGETHDEEMLRNGTSPDADNFASLALIPDGVRVFFQPYQVAPWVAGPQQVDIPLDELKDAGPRLDLWAKNTEQKGAKSEAKSNIVSDIPSESQSKTVGDALNDARNSTRSDGK